MMRTGHTDQITVKRSDCLFRLHSVHRDQLCNCKRYHNYTQHTHKASTWHRKQTFSMILITP